MESDFLLMVLRDLLKRRADLRLVLMSATLDAKLFEDYFGVGAREGGSRGLPARPPTISVAGRAFPVAAVWLEEAL